MHRNFMSTLPHCKSAQAVFKHVVRKVGVTVALKSESVHPDSCPCYRESVENQLWVCWTPIFCLCVLPPAEAMEVAQMALQSTQSCQTSGLSALQGVSLSQETLQGIDVNREKKEKKKDSYLKNAQIYMIVQELPHQSLSKKEESDIAYLIRPRSQWDLTPRPEIWGW